MSRPIRPSDALRRVVDDPRSALAGLATHRLRIFIRLTDALGSSFRRPVGRATLAAVGRVGARTSPSRLTLRVLGLDWAKRRADAVAEAERVGGDPATAAVTSLRAARLCLELGEPSAADRLIAARSADSDDDAALLLRVEVDWQLGRYRRAADGAERLLASRPRDRDARRLLGWAQSELTVLTPGWRPRLGGSGALAGVTGGRVLHLLTNSLPHLQGGYTVRSQDVGRCQQEAGLDPHMATRAGFPRSAGVRGVPASETVDGLTYWRLAPDLEPGSGSADIATRTAEAAQALIERLHPAVLHPTSNFINAQVALALRDRYRIPVVYEVRGFLEETWRSRIDGDVSDSDRYLAARETETAVMRDADAIVTLSETMRSDIVARGGVDPDHVVVVPNAVEASRFLPGPRDEALAASLGLGHDPVIGYISSFTAYEGIVHLIGACAELRRRGRPVRCLLVGDGEERAALEATARTAGLDDGTVVFTGRIPHAAVQDYYRLIDAFVVPRTNDRVSQLVTPLKPYEAMAMERALVVSGVPALLEIVDDGRTGRSFTPEDPLSLADVLEPLLDDPDERARLGRAAREWVMANRTWRQNGLRYLDLYRRLGVV